MTELISAIWDLITTPGFIGLCLVGAAMTWLRKKA